MAGFFEFFDGNKPGRGVEKGAPPKHAFFQFLEIFRNKLGRLILMNLCFFVVVIPLLTVAYTLVYDRLGWEVVETLPYSSMAETLFGAARSMPEALQYALLAVSLIFYGPLSCGMAFVLRNFVRREHTWFSDFFTRSIKNFGLGMFFGLLDAAVLYLSVYVLTLPADAASGDSSLTVSKLVVGVVSVLYLLMRNYFYIMAVTFDIKIWQILKNAWILGIVGLKRNLLILLINGAIGFVVFYVKWMDQIVITFLLFSLWGLISTYISFPVVKKYLIGPLEKQQSKTETSLEP